jgi:FKBP-type peptidyl-prolyl cis-trans isomerase
MFRPIVLAVAACLALSACEQSEVAGEIAKAEAELAKKKVEADKVAALEEEARKKSAGPNLAASKAFMVRKEAEGGWTKTQSGILYKWVRRNPANLARPTPDSVVLAFYEGKLADGSVFDSAYASGQPLTGPANGLIPGWQELLQMMKPGETLDAVIPPELAYGERGGPGGPNQALEFRVELLAFRTPPDGPIVGDPQSTPRDAPKGAGPAAAPKK